MCNLKQGIPKDINLNSYNGSNYDYRYIMKRLVEGFEEQFSCLGENTEK